ncbi:MAG: LuxR C-terminal-related transcriptional regulator [Bacteroidales bacterium]|nr:LuxR C-terminal-related transcriptional regulator [Bacteroidales bacterium]
MKAIKMYEAGDKMINLIRDNYNILQSLSAFGIPLGFGDKTVEETCASNHVDTTTFLAVVNFTINGATATDVESLSAATLLHYLEACHRYYLDYQLPFVRRQLAESINTSDEVERLILKLYDDYAREIRRHMHYEERMLFPYVERLMQGEASTNYSIELFSKQHADADKSLKELKNLIIKYLPADSNNSNKLTSALYLIYNNEQWLTNHQEVEDSIFVPVITRMEQNLKQERLSSAISAFANVEAENSAEAISDREKDVIRSVVQGMSNKEIAEHLCISVNTVITHRRNIARKLQIHSSAGLTIYAIVNGLVSLELLEK